jgi:ligand-binding SRPBCC domain-containing protein
MPHFEDSVDIDRPIEEVWDYLTDWFNTPRMGGYAALGLRQTSPGPTGVGSTLQGRNVILGFETRLNHTVTVWDPPHAFADTMEGRPFRSLSQRGTLESTAKGTRMVVSTEFELRPALRLLWPLLAPFVRRRMGTGVQTVKQLIEAQPDSGSGM